MKVEQVIQGPKLAPFTSLMLVMYALTGRLLHSPAKKTQIKNDNNLKRQEVSFES